MSGSRGRVTFLGTGTSHGVPMIGCRCATCTSTDSRDQRLRPSIYVEMANGGAFVIDTPPDLRTQALRFGVLRVDAVVFTHPHADHVLGLDEIRRFNALQRAVVPCYGDPETTRRCAPRVRVHVRAAPGGRGSAAARAAGGDRPVRGRRHDGDAGAGAARPAPILGYRIGTFAYLTDCSAIPDDSWPLLEGVRTLVVGALRHRPHPTHFTVAQALEVVARVRPERALLTHIAHDLGHAATSRVSRRASSWHMMV